MYERFGGTCSSGWTAGVRFMAGARNCSLLHNVHPASYTVSTGGCFDGGKTAGAWSWPPPSSAEVKNTWIYTSTPPYVLITWCWFKYMDNFTDFLLLAFFRIKNGAQAPVARLIKLFLLSFRGSFLGHVSLQDRNGMRGMVNVPGACLHTPLFLLWYSVKASHLFWLPICHSAQSWRFRVTGYEISFSKHEDDCFSPGYTAATCADRLRNITILSCLFFISRP
jgi:hypothetical protein